MDSRRAVTSLKAAARLRDLAVDDAKRALADATRLKESHVKSVSELEGRLIQAQTDEGRLLSAQRLIDPASLEIVRRYASWMAQELLSARRRLRESSRIETDALSALAAAARAYDSINELQERRCVEEQTSRQRGEQHFVDEQAALRLIALRRTSVPY